MQTPRRTLMGVLGTPVLFLGIGCSQPDNPKLTEAPPPPPPTAEEKADAKGKPAGYGANPAYQKAMERAANR